MISTASADGGRETCRKPMSVRLTCGVNGSGNGVALANHARFRSPLSVSKSLWKGLAFGRLNRGLDGHRVRPCGQHGTKSR